MLLLTAAVVGSGLLALALPDGVGPGDRDAPIGVPRVGDFVQFEGRDVPGGPVRSSLAFRWEERDVVGRFGEPMRAHVAAGAASDARDTYLFEVSFPPGRIEAVTILSDVPHLEQESTPVVSRESAGGSVIRRYDGRGGNALPCLARAGWQGADLRGLAGRDFYELCPSARPAAGEPSPAPLEDLGPLRVGGIESRAFAVDAFHMDGIRRITFVLAPGIPYPVELAFASDSFSEAFRLAAFDPGSGPGLASTGSAPDPPRRGHAVFGPPGKWGFVEGDRSSYEFPPGDAVASLEAAPPGSEPRRYLDAHPDARVVAFRYFEDRHDYWGASGRWPSWWFLLNDPAGEGFEALARRAPRAEAPPASVPGGGEPPIVVLGRDIALSPLDPTALPGEVMSLSDAITAWRDLAADPAPPTNRIFAALVQGVPHTGEAAIPGRGLFVGHVSYLSEPDVDDPASPGLVEGVRREGLVLELESGAAVVEYESTRRSDRSVTAPWSPGSRDWREAAPRPGDARAPQVPVAAAGAVLLATAAYAFRDALLDVLVRKIGAPLYSRIRRTEVLDNVARAAIFDAVRRSPGIHVNGLHAQIACGKGALRYHLEVLVREGFVSRVEAGRYVRFFPSGDLGVGEMGRQAALLAGSQEIVFRLIRERPGVSQRELSQFLGVSEAAVHHSVVRLERGGLVRRERIGRRRALFAVERG